MVVFIAVDLAVPDPILKAAHAFSRAVDIGARHRDYDIKVAFDTHGQNNSVKNAANFLVQHQTDTSAYTAMDLSKREDLASLLEKVRQETGATLAL